MFAAASGDDDNFSKLVRMQPKWLLGITALDGNRESVRMKPVFPLEGWVWHGESSFNRPDQAE